MNRGMLVGRARRRRSAAAPGSSRAGVAASGFLAWAWAAVAAAALCLFFFPLLGPVGIAWAADAFEIQVYDGTANAPGVMGLELHANDALDGPRTVAPPELPPYHLLHLTLEPSLGLTASWEVGAYLQTAVRPEGGFDFAGAKLRSKLVSPPGWRPHLRLGANVEVGALRARYETQRWGAELRPIVAWEDERWLFAVNPIVGFSLTGGGPTFEPAAMALIKLPPLVSLGLEYYADLGEIFPTSSRGSREDTLFEVVNLLAIRNVEVNAGVGEGLEGGGRRLVAKMILGYAFDPHHR